MTVIHLIAVEDIACGDAVEVDLDLNTAAVRRRRQDPEPIGLTWEDLNVLWSTVTVVEDPPVGWRRRLLRR